MGMILRIITLMLNPTSTPHVCRGAPRPTRPVGVRDGGTTCTRMRKCCRSRHVKWQDTRSNSTRRTTSNMRLEKRTRRPLKNGNKPDCKRLGSGSVARSGRLSRVTRPSPSPKPSGTTQTQTAAGHGTTTPSVTPVRSRTRNTSGSRPTTSRSLAGGQKSTAHHLRWPQVMVSHRFDNKWRNKK